MAKAKPQKFDPKAKAKKQKKMAIAGAVLLVALLAYQGPKTLKLLNPPPPPQSAPATTTPVTPTPAPVTPATPSTPVTPAPAGGGSGSSLAASPTDSLVVNADLAPVPLDGQLAALSQFTSKDPFKQQAVSTTASSGSAATPKTSAPTSPGATGGSSGSFTPGSTSGSSSSSGSKSSGSSKPAAPSSTIATISVNGVEMAVTVATDFPADSPFFHLVSLTATTAKIGIAGGTLATGSTVTLKKGKAVTLMNTADGTRYILVLISMGDTTTPVTTGAAAPTPPATAPGTSTTSTTGK